MAAEGESAYDAAKLERLAFDPQTGLNAEREAYVIDMGESEFENPLFFFGLWRD